MFVATPIIVVYDSVTGKATENRAFHGLGIPISLRNGEVTFINSKGDHFSIGLAPFN
jgi:hypothetical protein